MPPDVRCLARQATFWMASLDGCGQKVKKFWRSGSGRDPLPLLFLSRERPNTAVQYAKKRSTRESVRSEPCKMKEILHSAGLCRTCSLRLKTVIILSVRWPPTKNPERTKDERSTGAPWQGEKPPPAGDPCSEADEPAKAVRPASCASKRPEIFAGGHDDV